MMSGQQIRDLSREMTIKARQKHRIPFEFDANDIADLKAGRWTRINIPALGDYVPPRWQRTERDALFVDKTGMDKSGPALSISQFADALVVGKGYAIIEEGPFQVYIAEYERLPQKGKATL